MAEQNKPLAYTASDWFYLKSECANKSDDSNCIENREAVKQLRNSTEKLGTETTKYDDAKRLHNRELLFTVNMLMGLALIFYYIYANRSTLNFTKATATLKTVNNKLTNTISSVASRPSKF